MLKIALELEFSVKVNLLTKGVSFHYIFLGSSHVCDLTKDLKPHDEEDHQPGMPTLQDFLWYA